MVHTRIGPGTLVVNPSSCLAPWRHQVAEQEAWSSGQQQAPKLKQAGEVVAALADHRLAKSSNSCRSSKAEATVSLVHSARSPTWCP